MSVGGAFMVYYHVKEGHKVFFIALGTEENLDWMASKRPHFWILEGVEERAETSGSVLPAGCLHFVWTPEDSLVAQQAAQRPEPISARPACSAHNAGFADRAQQALQAHDADQLENVAAQDEQLARNAQNYLATLEVQIEIEFNELIN
ncbi:hypothetical protein B9Z55_007852 [Caenorhabditis nigoni]|uniref:JmjC domain-containing protein n=1 Tax=Caenorhabditis nigoni TaxID=1611254 RepID=A0A2G5VC76_9PELO|nr:hypothetical protein B9Z55_007852 [Caenorhabditis nigoni]